MYLPLCLCVACKHPCLVSPSLNVLPVIISWNKKCCTFLCPFHRLYCLDIYRRYLLSKSAHVFSSVLYAEFGLGIPDPSLNSSSVNNFKWTEMRYCSLGNICLEVLCHFHMNLGLALLFSVKYKMKLYV